MAKTRLLLAAATLSCLSTAVLGCEDNPDQLYKQAPPGAGDRWNNGKTPATYDPNAKNGFTDSFNSNSRQELCSGEEKHERWAKMVREDLKPPRFIAGIDLAGSDAWTGLDFRDAESKLCQSKAAGSSDPELLSATWGDGSEVSVDYSVATNTLVNWQLNPGYRGKLIFDSRDTGLGENGFPEAGKANPFGKHHFEIGIQLQILKDGRPHEINWQKDCGPTAQPTDACWQVQLTEMYDALMATYSPELQSTQVNCVAEQRCLGAKDPSGAGLFGVRPLGAYMVVPNWRVQPAASTPGYFYGFYVKLMPFSGAELYVKLDPEGPYAISKNIGSRNKTCVQRLGLSFEEFKANCIDINEDQKLNDFILGKFKGGMSRTKEAFDFSVEAVKLNFLSKDIGNTKVVGDDWQPQNGDTSHEFEMDIRASGKILNDWSADGKYETFAASGAIYREYARRVQNDIHAKLADFYGTRDAATLSQFAPLGETELPTVNGDRKFCPQGETLFGAAPDEKCGKCADGFEVVGDAPANRKCERKYSACTHSDDPSTVDPAWELNGNTCRFVGYGLGDKHCLLDPGEDPATWKPAPGCTGFEAWVSGGAHPTPDLPADKAIASERYQPGAEPLRLSLGWRGKAEFGLKTALKAGDPLALFCSDPPPNGKGMDAGPDKKPPVCTSGDQCFSGNCIAPTASQKASWPDLDGKQVCQSPTAQYFNYCDDDQAGNKILSGSFTRVLNVLGQGKLLSLPSALRDKKFYFRHLAAAIVKYLKAAPAKPEMAQPIDLAFKQYMPGPEGTACDVNGIHDSWGCEPEPDHLLFDQMIDLSDRDKFEYIDRRYTRQLDGSGNIVETNTEATKVEYEILINSSNQQNWKYHRKRTRPERKLYDIMKGDNVRLTNLVGSPVIENAFKGTSCTKDAAGTVRGCLPGEGCTGETGSCTTAPDSNGKIKVKDAHYCASTLLPQSDQFANADAAVNGLAPDVGCPSTPPQDYRHGGWMLDDYGQPLLTNYRGAFAGTGTIFKIGQEFMKLEEELPYIKSARVNVPIFPDPYRPGGVVPSAASDDNIVLVDWRPETPANGIRIPVNAQLDRFVPSATIVFGGSSLSLDLDYREDPKTHMMRLEGVQSDDYMGNIFVCESGGDILSIEQYESMDVISDWLNAHPGSREACGILTRFSAFGDYPLLFAARNAGLVLNVGLGSGVGRITNIEIYDTLLQ